VNTTAKLALGAATIWPLVYIVIFMIFIFSMFWGVSHDPTPSVHAGPPTAFFGLFAVHLLTMLEIIGLVIFYVVDAFRNPRITENQRILWAILIFVGGPLGMAVYWYLNIWRTPPVAAAP
jgi:hypothetical protein